MRTANIIVLALVLVSAALSLWAYPLLPDQLVSHWNSDFQPDGYMGKALGLALFPMIIAFLAALFMLFPRIDPLKTNIEAFRGDFDYFIVLLFAFLIFLQAAAVFWNMGYTISFAVFMPLWMSAIFFSAGTLCKRARRNWFIGIRTPWAMSSERVWAKTNQKGGMLFQIAGIHMLLGLVVPHAFFAILIAFLVLIGVYVTTYSYLEYQKELKETQAKKKSPAAKRSPKN